MQRLEIYKVHRQIQIYIFKWSVFNAQFIYFPSIVMPKLTILHIST